MDRWVALLRGVNVGGANRLPMVELRAALTSAGWRGIATYIASGNVVFTAPGPAEALQAQLADVLARTFGLTIPATVLPASAIRAALAGVPEAPADPRHLHVAFLLGPAAPARALIRDLKTPSETLTLGDGVAYLHAPEGIGRSKLAARLETALGTPLTARNLRTVQALAAMLDG
jgi:uncharacterized protein (DUF1697 family)